jgi:hypothetical protein
MRNLRTLGIGLSIAMLLAACGGNAGKSGEPGSSSEASGAPSSAASVEPSDGGGGNGGLGDASKGTATFELTGAASRSGTFAVVPIYGVVLDPATQGVALVYVDEASSASLSINSGGAGAAITYADNEIGVIMVGVPSVFGECSVDYDEFEADHVKGNFRCEHMSVVQNGETVLGEGTLSGSFEARK